MDLERGTKRTDTRAVTPVAHDDAEEGATNEYTRRLPAGAELAGPDIVSFRVWAPQRNEVALYVRDGDFDLHTLLQCEANGYFSTAVGGIGAGALYGFRLDGGERIYPDPASRFQPDGHDGLSQLVNPMRFKWTDERWEGLSRVDQVIYEMHVGTFTAEGTWASATSQLPWLAALGITALEIMPVGEFPGRFGWGYDLVHLFAPTHLYGTPDDMRAFIDAAHALEMGVILDVVYNHCGCAGCFLQEFSRSYFSTRHKNEWGNAFNFDDDDSEAVRDFVTANAAYWVTEFHVDGFRLDATQQIFDDSPVHVIADIVACARIAAGKKELLIVAENEPQDVRLLQAATANGYDVDALLNDDFHHSAIVAVTGRAEAYYGDHAGSPQELISAVKRGFLYQGQYYSWQRQPRGTPTVGLAPERFVSFLQNHDQVANSARGLRLHELTSPGRWRAITALLLLAPATPMIFQGQEFAASTPFLYFADTGAEVAALVRDGRRDFMMQFASIAAGGDACLADPAATETFTRCTLDLSEREGHAAAVALHRDLLRLRHADAVFSGTTAREIDGAVIGSEAFVLRFSTRQGDDRLLIVNLGRELALSSIAEPLIAPPAGGDWKLMWSSENPVYGGDGTFAVEPVNALRLPGHAAVVLHGRSC